MKKYIFLTVFFIALLSACSQTKPPANVDDNPEAKASQAIVEQYISAYKNNDADALLALYSDDYVVTLFVRL
jgi:PBP1b-binding outer membrane lipoprotein LpoB